MDKSNSDFLGGLVTGILLSVVVYVFMVIMTWFNNNEGFDNKLVIQYHNPHKEYDRQLVMDMVNTSGIITNFVNKEVSMSPWRMEWKLTNPIK